jgi:hypothetical protein
MEDPQKWLQILLESFPIPSREHDEKCLQKNSFMKTRGTFFHLPDMSER